MLLLQLHHVIVQYPISVALTDRTLDQYKGTVVGHQPPIRFATGEQYSLHTQHHTMTSTLLRVYVCVISSKRFSYFILFNSCPLVTPDEYLKNHGTNIYQHVKYLI